MQRFAAAALGAALVVLASCSSEPQTGSETGRSPEEILERDTGVPWVVDRDPKFGAPDLLAPKSEPPRVLEGGKTPKDAALEFFDRYREMFGMAEPRAELVVEEEGEDEGAHVRFRQTKAGVPVHGATMSVHFTPTGSIGLVNGLYVPRLAAVPTVAKRTPEEAVIAAEGHFRTRVADYDRQKLIAKPAPVLHVYPFVEGAPILAYELALAMESDAGLAHFHYVVDAESGALLLLLDGVEKALVAASGKGSMFYPPVGNAADIKRFDADRTNPQTVVMRSPAGAERPEITTFARRRGFPIVSSSADSWDENATAGRGAAVDAMARMTEVEGTFRALFGRESYDNKNGKLEIVVHPGAANAMLAAFWDGVGGFHFGDGDVHSGGTIFPLSATREIVAHEYMHAVTQKTSRLEYQSESGALNESLADIFAVLVEHHVNPSASPSLFADGWRTSGPAIRDLAHPFFGVVAQPDHVTKMVHRGVTPTDSNDHGGVHSNSGIPNNAWYLMTIGEGAKNDTSGIEIKEGIGWAASQRLWWRMNRWVFGRKTTFDAAARWMVPVARLSRTSAKAVACAWVATGVLQHEYVKRKWDIRCFCEDKNGQPVTRNEDLPCCEKDSKECCRTCGENTCSTFGRATCDPGTKSFGACDKFAFKCKSGSFVPPETSPGRTCQRVDQREENPWCCLPGAQACALVKSDCEKAGLEFLFCEACRVDDGPPVDSSMCKKSGPCTTNNECCGGCCQPTGTCL